MRMTSFIGALLLSLLMAGTAEKAHAGLFVSITVAPPPLAVYSQPPLPGPDYLWTPGYWSWDDDAGDYYWVPGAWVVAPEPGLLWTPGYWGWNDDSVYVWNDGYWGPHVGFYGGIDYGYGYGGEGFEGGYWRGGVFTYNRAVMNVGVGISVSVYSKTVIKHGGSQASFNGGNGGVKARPNHQELAYANEHRVSASSEQLKHRQLASKNPVLKLSHNHGKPSIAATSKAGDFSKGHVFGAKAAGSGFKPTSLKTQGGPLGGKTSAGAGPQHFGPANHVTPHSKPAGANLGAANHGTGGANFGAANRFHSNNLKSVSPPRGAALQGARRPGPAPRPAFRPVVKAPADNNKKPH